MGLILKKQYQLFVKVTSLSPNFKSAKEIESSSAEQPKRKQKRISTVINIEIRTNLCNSIHAKH